jgi:Outer membrane protein beta-barrel domain
MKNILFVCFALCAFSAQTFAQAKFGIKLGTATSSGQFGSIMVNQPDTAFNVALKDAKYGLSGGIWLRAGNRFFVQPEVYFNSTSNQYALDGAGFQQTIKKEKFQYLDIPVIFGAKLGPLSLQAGPVGHYTIKSTSELTNVPGYNEKLEDFTFGYQAGGGLDFGRIGLDVRYQGRFASDKGGLSFFGKQYEFDQSPASIVAALRIKLF